MFAKLKTKPSAPEPAEPTFAESRAAFTAARTALASPNAELEALNVLATWNAASDAERESDRFAGVREKFKNYWSDKSPPAAWRIPGLVSEINERIQLAHAKWIEAQPAWAHACSRETSQIAKSMQPRQRAAVKKIAAAVTALSEAMHEERELHRELERTAPNPTSAYLPRCSPNIAGVEDHTGELFAWRRRIRQLKILD